MLYLISQLWLFILMAMIAGMLTGWLTARSY